MKTKALKILMLFTLVILTAVTLCACGGSGAQGDTQEGCMHSYVETNTQDATCDSEGYIEYECRTCGESRYSPIPPKGHDFEYAEGKEPTCTEEGYSGASVCKICGEVEYAGNVRPPLGHEEIYVESINPTCTEYGYTEGYYCQRCESYTVEPELVPMKNHSNCEVVEGYDPTCTEEGLTDGIYCFDCNIYTQEQTKIPATGHIPKLVTEAKNPTCTEEGCTEGYACENCGEVTTASEVIESNLK